MRIDKAGREIAKGKQSIAACSWRRYIQKSCMKMTGLRDVTPSSPVARDQVPPPSGFTLKNDKVSFFEMMETSYKTTHYTPS
jgi:hypothetical protein